MSNLFSLLVHRNTRAVYFSIPVPSLGVPTVLCVVHHPLHVPECCPAKPIQHSLFGGCTLPFRRLQFPTNRALLTILVPLFPRVSALAMLLETIDPLKYLFKSPCLR